LNEVLTDRLNVWLGFVQRCGRRVQSVGHRQLERLMKKAGRHAEALYASSGPQPADDKRKA
jgi:hypothetical protein